MGVGQTGKSISFFVFWESLHNQKFWFQIRSAVRLQFSWMSISAFYAQPIMWTTIKIGDEEGAGAGKYWGGELNIVPANWARIYGDALSIEKSYTKYRIGAEIRPLKWFSISTDYNKTSSNIYSKWSNYQEFRFALNILLGSQQKSFKIPDRVQMQPMYPILVRTAPPFVEGKAIVEFMYERMEPIILPNETDPYWMQILLEEGRKLIKVFNAKNWHSYGYNKWICEAELDFSLFKYSAYTLDIKITGVYRHIGKKISARIKGIEPWIELTCVKPELDVAGEHAEFFFDSKGIHTPCK